HEATAPADHLPPSGTGERPRSDPPRLPRELVIPVTTLAEDLARAVSGEVDDSTTARAMFSMDASNYRHVPRVVVFPRTTEDVAATLRVCRAHGVPVTARGAGTGIGGQALGEGGVLDDSRHRNKVLEVDPERRIRRVQPARGIGPEHAAAAKPGLPFG